jgi:hypothetical protein
VPSHLASGMKKTWSVTAFVAAKTVLPFVMMKQKPSTLDIFVKNKLTLQ